MKNGWYEDNGCLRHYVYDKSHNYKSPAGIWKNGGKFYRKHGTIHRLDGPACEYFNGHKEWYYQGEEIKCKSQQEFERYLKLKVLW